MTIASIGEILWDVVGEREHLGGAPFNLTAHAARLKEDVIFVSAVGADDRGQRARARMAELGISDRFVSTVPGLPTGWASVRIDASGQPAFRIHRPLAYEETVLNEAALDSIAALRPAWICYGTLFQASSRGRAALEALLLSNRGARHFYDLNLRPQTYTATLVRQLLASADAVKLNDSEAIEVGNMLDIDPYPLKKFCGSIAQRYKWQALCVTKGPRGCALWVDGVYCEHEGYVVRVADTVGAGDAFAAAFLHGLNAGWPAPEIADFGNRVAALVASRPGATPDWSMEEAMALSPTKNRFSVS